MPSTQNPGRFAGLLYILTSIPGVFAMMYVPSKLIVHANAAATAGNIAAHETLRTLTVSINRLVTNECEFDVACSVTYKVIDLI